MKVNTMEEAYEILRKDLRETLGVITGGVDVGEAYQFRIGFPHEPGEGGAYEDWCVYKEDGRRERGDLLMFYQVFEPGLYEAARKTEQSFPIPSREPDLRETVAQLVKRLTGLALEETVSGMSAEKYSVKCIWLLEDSFVVQYCIINSLQEEVDTVLTYSRINGEIQLYRNVKDIPFYHEPGNIHSYLYLNPACNDIRSINEKG